MPTGTIAPPVKHTFFDANGDPLNGGKLFVYSAGTTTKATTHSDVGLTTPNANPIVLDSAGRCTIFLTPGVSYKFVLAPSADTTDPPASPVWTVDNVAAVPVTAEDVDITGTAGEAISAGDAVYCSDGSSGTVAGRWYKCDSDAVATSTGAVEVGFAPAAIASGESGSIRKDGRVTGLAGLSTGSAYYLSSTAGGITASAPTNARLVGFADSTTSLVLTPHGPNASATLPGIITTGAQTIAGVKTFSSPPLYTTGGAATAYIGGRVNSTYVSVGNVGGGEDDLMTYPLAAGTLGTDGKAVRVLAWGTSANNANAKVLKAYFGATQLLGGAGFSLTASQAGNWLVGFNVLRTGAATQRAAASAIVGPAGGPATASCTGVTTPAETLANAITIKLTGTGTANDDIVQTGMMVSVVE